jgi:hypothetical protein
LLLLLWRRRTGLKGHLLRSLLLLELLVLLPWEARVLRLLRLRLLSKALRLARKASKLRLHRTSSESRRLRCQSTLKASRLLLEGLLLLLPILRLPRSGTITTP